MLSLVRVVGFALATVISGLGIMLNRLVYRIFHNNLPPQAASSPWMRIWGLWCMKVYGIPVTVEGALPPPGALILPNHTGYADIMAMSSATACLFVAKSETARWPALGFFVRIAANIFVERENRRSLSRAIEDIERCLKAGVDVCVFLEGTSSGGGSVLPFRPSLVEAGLLAGAPLVPAAICWKTRPPVLIEEDIAYWKDHHFPAHFWKFLGLRDVTVTIEFGEPIQAAGLSRKAAAHAAQTAVEAMLNRQRGQGKSAA